jgi:hypothetical protein
VQALEVVSIQYPLFASAFKVAAVTILDCQAILAKPVAVPLLGNLHQFLLHLNLLNQ